MGSQQKTVQAVLENDSDERVTRLPADLAVLNRLGIGYPYLIDAWRRSQAEDRPASQILIEAGAVSPELWHVAKQYLDERRRTAYLEHRKKRHLLRQAITNLNRSLPHYSARLLASNQQLYRYAALLAALSVAFWFWHELTMLLIFLGLSIFYFLVICLRTGILAEFPAQVQLHNRELVEMDDTLPVYSVLVALRHEKSQIRPLCQHLYQLDWPKEKLDIKLICEADDHETIAEILDCKLPSCFHLVTVPVAEPQTKPKALNYALPLALGEFVVLYDAEDRPVPHQLREAYTRFLTEDDRLACLQAPLRIHNQAQNWLTAMFSIEYLTLFNGILPALGKWGAPLPLGGTSNHFRVDVLKEVGGWDPYNVTEDADLGIRICREGYRTATITAPTYEEAPPKLDVWIKQRTRWLKGWMQTLLVHDRNPLHLARDLGLRNLIVYQLVLTALVLSVLLHPFLLAGFFYHLVGNLDFQNYAFGPLVLATSAFNLVGGYTTYGLLAYVVLRTEQETSLLPLILCLPVYWLLVSFASWRAVFHLIVKPHFWEKTPHGLAKQNFHITTNPT